MVELMNKGVKAKAKAKIKAEPGLRRLKKIEAIDRGTASSITPWLVQVCNLYPRTEDNNRMVELMNKGVKAKAKAKIKAEPGLMRLKRIEAIGDGIASSITHYTLFITNCSQSQRMASTQELRNFVLRNRWI